MRMDLKTDIDEDKKRKSFGLDEMKREKIAEKAAFFEF